MKMHDLTGILENGMWDYRVLPGLEHLISNVTITTRAEVKKEGFFASDISLSTLSGTYLEAGSHILPGGKNLDYYSIDDFIKPAKIVRIPDVHENESIQKEKIVAAAPEISPGEALIFDTGWYSRWNTDGYVLRCPNYSKDALKWVLEKKPSIFGVDVPCIEAAWSEGSEEEKGSMLTKIFESGSLLAAPLVNCNRIEQDYGTLFCLPLKVKGTCGAPARVIFAEGLHPQ